MKRQRSKENARGRRHISPDVEASVSKELIDKALTPEYRLGLSNDDYVYASISLGERRNAKTFHYTVHGYEGALTKAMAWMDAQEMETKQYLGSILRDERSNDKGDKTVFRYRVAYYDHNESKWRQKSFSLTAYQLNLAIAQHCLRTAEQWLADYLDSPSGIVPLYPKWRTVKYYADNEYFNWKVEYDYCNETD